MSTDDISSVKKKADLSLVAYCGIYCGNCAQRVRVPRQSSELRKTLHEEGFDDFYQYVPEMRESFPAFWKFLGELSEFDCSCRGGGGGPPDCEIRECARKRGIDVCPDCDDYPCRSIERLAQRYPLLIPDGKRMIEIGYSRWIDEAEERGRRGFCYSDSRYR